MGDCFLANTFSRWIGRKHQRPSDSNSVELATHPRKRLSMTPPPDDTSPLEETPLTLQKASSIVERLPPELYMAMVRKMSPVEGVLLSLTCKALWARVTLHSTDVLHKVQRCLSLDETMHFLRMLEKDNCRYVICTACLKLHCRMKDETKFVRADWGCSYGLRPCTDELGSLAMKNKSPNCLQIPREIVELLLRRAALGRDFGPSLNILYTSCAWVVWSVIHFRVTFCSDAIILRGRDHHDHLLLKTSYSFEVDLRRPIGEQVKDSSAAACQHKTDDQHKIIAQAIKHPEKFLESENVRALWTCSHCPTDMLVEVSEIPGEVFSTINISVIRDAGSRGDHRSSIWGSQSYQILGRHSHRTVSFDRSVNYPFGNQALHALWDEGLAKAEEEDADLDPEKTPVISQDEDPEKEDQKAKSLEPENSQAQDSEDKGPENLGLGLFD